MDNTKISKLLNVVSVIYIIAELIIMFLLMFSGCADGSDFYKEYQLLFNVLLFAIPMISLIAAIIARKKDPKSKRTLYILISSFVLILGYAHFMYLIHIGMLDILDISPDLWPSSFSY